MTERSGDSHLGTSVLTSTNPSLEHNHGTWKDRSSATARYGGKPSFRHTHIVVGERDRRVQLAVGGDSGCENDEGGRTNVVTCLIGEYKRCCGCCCCSSLTLLPPTGDTESEARVRHESLNHHKFNNYFHTSLIPLPCFFYVISLFLCNKYPMSPKHISYEVWPSISCLKYTSWDTLSLYEKHFE